MLFAPTIDIDLCKVNSSSKALTQDFFLTSDSSLFRHITSYK